MEQVKKLYLKGDYKQCAAWCKQILDNIKDPYRVHPLNSLYISFYCATCLEITASSLHNNAPQKLTLLQDALAYYQKAESYIPFAEIPTAPYFQAGSRVSSASSSLRSSVDSVFSSALSSASTADTLSPLGSSSCSSYEEDESTPSRKRTGSVSSAMSTRSDTTSDEPLKPAPVRVKKKVSFSAQLPTLISTDTLTDSPTNETPPPPPPYALPHPPILRPNPTTPPQTLFPSPSPLHLASLQTYTLTLTSLSSQLRYHITHIQALIASILRIRKSRRSNGPCSFAPSLDLTNQDPEARKKKELRERIERLRTQGWPRRRLDADRYERLREKVEMELCGWIV
ncbi:hypothetical protein ACMFMF_004956 [Clarireedia jacksonii]